MIRRLVPPFAALLLLATAGCDRNADRGAIDVSAIGAAARVVDPNRGPVGGPDAVLMGAVAQGLVAFDAAGQIEPALASRWDVSDDGLYYTFRLDDARGLDANSIVRRLRAAIARSSRNSLKPYLGAIAEVIAVTPQIVEIRLRGPRPNLLQLLAQPELSLTAGKNGAGAGPFVVAAREHDTILLRRAPADEDKRLPEAVADVRLWAERAARAVARFASGESSLALGGSYADIAIPRAARIPAAQIRIDPAQGLFGLEVARMGPFLREGSHRRALAMALDRERITDAFGVPGWTSATATTPAMLEGLAAPARPDWIVASPVARRALARRLVAEWTATNGIPSVRVALPDGPGSRLLLALLQVQWGEIGVAVSRASAAEADLRLVDAVAPADLASWYLRRFTCDRSPVCSPEADAALLAARAAPTLAERSASLAAADRILADLTPFIPIATPLRWSLVSPRLDAFRPNVRAVHPLHHLRTSSH